MIRNLSVGKSILYKWVNVQSAPSYLEENGTFQHSSDRLGKCPGIGKGNSVEKSMEKTISYIQQGILATTGSVVVCSPGIIVVIVIVVDSRICICHDAPGFENAVIE